MFFRIIIFLILMILVSIQCVILVRCCRPVKLVQLQFSLSVSPSSPHHQIQLLWWNPARQKPSSPRSEAGSPLPGNWPSHVSPRLDLGDLGCVRLMWVPRSIALLQICAEMVHLGRHHQPQTDRQFLKSPALERALAAPCAPSARCLELFAPGSAP
uniref:Secreted protein n=1 Tax=Kalanchoe fedtschenkoi TaxID=63787 RepID=A0A7N0UDF9_KALFE